MSEQRQYDLTRFYELLDRLEGKVGGARQLSKCDGKMSWPKQGVYFFREAGERCKETGDGPRIVRVGTHALKTGASTKLWGRLKQHKGTVKPFGGDHRSSIFRKIVGAALIEKHEYDGYPKWGHGSSASKEVKASERPLERKVSAVIGAMPSLWLAVEDAPGPDSLRGYIEGNAIGLLSNYGRDTIDSPSTGWLGWYSDRDKVRKSGLWNNNHVDSDYDPAFLDTLEQQIDKMGEAKRGQ